MHEALSDNQALWDAWTRIHVPSAFYDVASFRDGTRPIRLADYELDEVGPVEGRTLLHLQCHFGLDTLSWARLGARVTGVDFSGEAIAAARALAADLGIDARFVQSDLYDAASAIQETFDIVYTSRGVLGWMPDIEGWARVAARFVRPGGFLYVTDIHPVANVLADDAVAPGELRLGYPYWSHPEPLTFQVHGSYADATAPTPDLVEHGWDHSLGEIVTALIDAGLRIELLREYPFVEWALPFLVPGEGGRYRLPPDAGGELPLFFSLRASRPASASDDARLAPEARAAAYADGSAVGRRGADELHDTVGQSLVAAYRFLDASRARAASGGGPVDPDLEAAHAQVLAAMRELRVVIDGLSPPGLADRGLEAAIREWADRQNTVGSDIAVSGGLDPGNGALDAIWFDLVTAGCGLGARPGAVGRIEIELRDSRDGRIITLTGDSLGPALAALRHEDGTETFAWMRRVAGRLGGSIEVHPAGPAGATVVIEGPRGEG